jgi:RNA polymerase sigma factor (sigma-70 family)
MRTRMRTDIPTPARQLELVRLAQAGDEGARHELALSILPFIWRMAGSYLRHADYDDLVNGAMAEVMVAIDKFDQGNPAQFLGYAKWWIRRGIQVTIAETRMVRNRGYHRQELAAREARAAVDPAYREKWEASKAKRARVNAPPASLSEARGDDGRTIGDSIESPYDEPDWEGELRDAIDALDPRTADIIRRRFWEGDTLSEIAGDIGRGRERVRQIAAAGLGKLGKIMTA